MKTCSVVHSLALAFCLLAPASVLAYPNELSIPEPAQGIQNEAIHKELHKLYGDRFKHVELARRQTLNNSTSTVTTSSVSEPPPPSIETSIASTPSSDYSSTPVSTPTSEESSTTTPQSTPKPPPKFTPNPTYDTNPITSKKTRTVTGEGGLPSTELSIEVITPTSTNGAKATSDPSVTSKQGDSKMAGGMALEVRVINMFIGVFAVAAGAILL